MKLLITTDLHGYIYPTNYTTQTNIDTIGLARIATAIKTYRKEEKDLILIDNGDSFQGSPLLSYALNHNKSNNPIAEAFNVLNYDFINTGNHDFNYGQEVFFNFINQNQAHLLTQNIYYKNKAIGSYKIIEKDNRKIAFIGITTHYIPNWEQAKNIEGFSFKDAYTSLKETVETLKDEVDFLIAVYHGGLEKEPQTGEPTEMLTGENQGYEMSQIEGLDLLITGHQHRSLIENVHNITVTQSANKASEFVLVDIDLETKAIHAELKSAGEFEADAEILNMFQDLEDKTQVWLDQPVGVLLDKDLLIHDEFEARLKKHPLISFLNQVQLDKTNADVSCTALFNDAKGFNQSITNRDLVSTYVYPNTLVVKKMRGQTLKEMIDYASEYFDVDENGNIKVRDSYVYPKPQHYNYDMFDGVSYTIKASNPKGQRILDLKVNGKPIDEDADYTVVMNNYRAMGGGDYDMVLHTETVKTYQEEMIEVLSDYFKQNSPVKINHIENIKVIP